MIVLRGKVKYVIIVKKQQVSVCGGLRGIYVRSLFEKGGLIVLSAHLPESLILIPNFPHLMKELYFEI